MATEEITIAVGDRFVFTEELIRSNQTGLINAGDKITVKEIIDSKSITVKYKDTFCVWDSETVKGWIKDKKLELVCHNSKI